MMAQPREALSREDQFARKQSRLLLYFAGSFGVWQLASLLAEGATSAARGVILVFQLAGSALWMASFFALWRNARLAKNDAALRAALQDERARDVRLRAHRVAFWATVGVAWLLSIPGAAHLVPATLTARLVVLVAVVSFIFGYVVLDRE